jgi:hypothetical protein
MRVKSPGISLSKGLSLPRPKLAHLVPALSLEPAQPFGREACVDPRHARAETGIGGQGAKIFNAAHFREVRSPDDPEIAGTRRGPAEPADRAPVGEQFGPPAFGFTMRDRQRQRGIARLEFHALLEPQSIVFISQ